MRDKLTPRKLNKSADERLIPKTNLIDALNILVTSSEGETGNEGVIKAARGNEEITYSTSTGTGTAKVIGSVTDTRLKVIYMFLYSSNPAEHGVYAYDPYGNLPVEGNVPDRVHRIHTSVQFDFDEFGYVKGDIVYIGNQSVDSDDERYEKDPVLYFTDGNSEPKKLNVFRCLLGQAPATGANETDFITACPKLGLKTLKFVFTSDINRATSNFTNTKGFQFAYQLIYEDGVESAISPYSDIAFPPVLVNQGANEVVDHVANNLCKIYFDTAIGNRNQIEKIRLLAREGNDGFFFAIDEFKKDEDINATYEDTTTPIWDSTNYEYNFYNDRIVTGISPIEVAKQFDNLPRLAKAQAVINNRLMYGNYVDGYDEQKIICSSSLIFKERPNDFETGVINVRESIREIPTSDSFASNSVPQINKTSSYIIDCNNLPDVIPEGTIINLSLIISPDRNYHLYNAARSYHQHATLGDSEYYDFYLDEDGGNPIAIGQFSPTFQTPERSGETFLKKITGDGNISEAFPIFGNNLGVLNELTWKVADGPPNTEGTNYVGTTWKAAIGTSAGAPFIIPASGPSATLNFSVSLVALQDLTNSKEKVAHGIAAALSGVDDFTQLNYGGVVGIGNELSVLSVDRVSTINVDQGYSNFQTFTDGSPTGKLVMSVSGAPDTRNETGAIGGASTFEANENRAEDSAKGYVLLNKGEIDFFFEHHFVEPDADGFNDPSGSVTTPSGYGEHEVRLGVKDMRDLEFVTCMRKADYRGVKTINYQGPLGGRLSAFPFTQPNNTFDVYDHAPWFILKNSLIADPGFSLSSVSSQLPQSPEGAPGTLSLRKALNAVNNGEYNYLLDDHNFTIYRYVDPSINNTAIQALAYPNFAQENNVSGFDYETNANVTSSSNESVNDALFDLPGFQTPQQQIAYPHEVSLKDGFRYSCGRLIQGTGVGQDTYPERDFGGLEAQPNFTDTDQPNTNYRDNIRFKFSLMDGEGGPGGFRRITQGAPSMYGSVGYASAAPIYNSDLTEFTFGANSNPAMLGPYWNGNIVSGDYVGITSTNLNSATETVAAFNQLGLDTARSQDAFLMPGIAAGKHSSLGLDFDNNPTSFPMGYNGTLQDRYHPLGAYLSTASIDVEDQYEGPDGGQSRNASYHQNRIYKRSDRNGNIESTAFGGLVAPGGSENRSFKTSAFHSFGVVYYDERGRHGFVNPATTVYVPGYSVAERTENAQGAVNVVLDFSETVPPPWATNWKLVYAPNSTVDFFVQHMSGGAYTAFGASGESGSSTIYVSLNYLQESIISYTSAFGARGPEGELNIYKFKDGDRVRVIYYQGTNGEKVYPQDVVFDVVDVKNFGPAENPLATTGSTNAPNWLQGQFLVLRNNPLADGFNFNSVANGQDFWGDNCLIEIFSPKKKQSEEAVYFEIPDQAYTDPNNDYLPYCAGGQLFPQQVTVVQGDVWWRPIAMNIRPYASGDENPQLFDISNTGLVNLIEDTPLGAAAGANPSTPRFRPVTAESMTASDLVDGDSSFIGRPNAYLPGAKAVIREATITYSDFNSPESNKVRYSSFNLATANFKDLNEEFGGIDFMMNESGDILVLQKDKVSLVPASKTLFSDTAGGNTVVASTNVLGTGSTFGIRAGCDGNPESVAVTPSGHVYFAHKTLGKIYRYVPSGGITVISDKNMASFFRDAFRNALATSNDPNFEDLRIPGGYDPLTEEYIITIKDLGDDEVGGDSWDPTETVYGCTNPNALNYNPFATEDDGSCVLPPEEEEEDPVIDLEFSPDGFGFGQNIMTTEVANALFVGGSTAAAIAGEVALSETVFPTNEGEADVKISNVDLVGLQYINDFTVSIVNGDDIIGVDATGEGIRVDWGTSGAYIINPGAQVRVTYHEVDNPSNFKIEFLPITGLWTTPDVDPPAPKYVKVWLNESGPNEIAPEISLKTDAVATIQYNNLVPSIGFPETSSVPSQRLDYTSLGSDDYRYYQVKIEASGITQDDFVSLKFDFSSEGFIGAITSPGASDLVTPFLSNAASQGGDSVAEIFLGEHGGTAGVTQVTFDALMDDEGNTLGEQILFSFALTKKTYYQDIFADLLPEAVLWGAGLETQNNWVDSNDDPAWTVADPNIAFNQPIILSITAGDEVGTNLSVVNGDAEFEIDASHTYQLQADPTYGYIRNTPANLRQYSDIPGCFRYEEATGETQVPVAGTLTQEIYNNYLLYTSAQSTAQNLVHPALSTEDAIITGAVANVPAGVVSGQGSLSESVSLLQAAMVGKTCPGQLGCTIETACNYDPSATYDNGTCVFPEEGFDCDGNSTTDVYGCTDSSAENYNPEANIDDGSCIIRIEGCTNPAAENYNPDATIDDGSCEILGCTDPNAINYDPIANKDDGSCEYQCNGTIPCSLDRYGEGIITAEEFNAAAQLVIVGEATDFQAFKEAFPAFAGCTNEEIIAAWDKNGDGSISTADILAWNAELNFPYPCRGQDFTLVGICKLLDKDGVVTLEQIAEVFTVQGITPVAGFDETTTFTGGIDFDGDGVVSYIDFLVAVELIGTNYDSALFAKCPGFDDDQGGDDDDDGGDGPTRFGCTDPRAFNYDPNAVVDDGSCIYRDDPRPPFGDPDLDDPIVEVDDGEPIRRGAGRRTISNSEGSGCTDPNAINYDPSATQDDGSCVYVNRSRPSSGGGGTTSY